MSDINGSGELATDQIFLTALGAAQLAHVDKYTLLAQVKPDAHYQSVKGDKLFGLWLRSTIEAYRQLKNAEAGE